MSFEGFPKGSKRPPPQHGIKVRELGHDVVGPALDQGARAILARLLEPTWSGPHVCADRARA